MSGFVNRRRTLDLICSVAKLQPAGFQYPIKPVEEQNYGPSSNPPTGLVIDFDDLAHTDHSHEFAGSDHGAVPFSVILVHSAPGAGPKLHRHPYAEVFIVESGEATFQLGENELVVTAGQVVVGPPNVPHGFTNTGRGELRLTAIHGSGEFVTEWLSGVDTAWIPRAMD